ncbi:Hypothetical protein D9617_23g005760 [Elsinoe fawcettii]|nr:Hypothetical protein D9617_23g005760 [Elsinoe fawcettii]
MPRQLPPDVRHRLIIEQITARQGKVQTAASTTPASATATSVSRFSTNYYQDTPVSNGFLSPWNSSDGALTEKLPGLKASKTFLSSLRTNLSLPDCPSPAHSPALAPQHPSPLIISSTVSLPPPAYRSTTSALAAMDLDATTPLQGRTGDDPTHRDDTDAEPQLTTYLTTSPDETTAALRLIADSVAQQRATAARALIFHPANLAVFIGLCSVIARLQYKTRSDLGLVIVTLAGVAMATLAIIRWITGGYIDAAEQITRNMVEGRDVWVSKYGEEIIGTAVVEWTEARRGSTSGSANGERELRRRGSDGMTAIQGHARRGSSGKRRRGRRGDIYAWTVRLRYRSKGIGEGLLEAVVDEAKSRNGEVVFAEEHANSKRILPDWYNSAFNAKEERARLALQNVSDARRGNRKR